MHKNPQSPGSSLVWRKSNVLAWAILVGFATSASVAVAVTLQVSVQHTFGAGPLRFEALAHRNASGEMLSFTRLSYLLAGFELKKGDGSWVELPGQVAWIDVAQGRTSLQIDNIPSGQYQALRCHLGLDAARNHANPAQYPAGHPLNPNLNGLHWNWQGGYIFLAVEGHYASSTNRVPAGYAYHFAGDTNRTPLFFSAALDLTADASLQLKFDLGQLLGGPRVISFVTDGSSTHARDGDLIAAALRANLPASWSVGTATLPPARSGAAKRVQPLYLPETLTPYSFKMGSTFPVPDLPLDNPLIEERVALGEELFSETALSRDGSISCASCHQGSAAFSDPRRYSEGIAGRRGLRNSMPLFNLAWKSEFFWDGRAPTLRAQALMPIQDHREMDESLARLVAKLSNNEHSLSQTSGPALSAASSTKNRDANYPALFERAFGSREITPEKVGLALEQFLLTLTSYDSKFDRAVRGEETLSAAEQRGLDLFMTEFEPRTGRFGADCFHCHGGPMFSDHQFHNNGLDAEDAGDPGRFRVTRRASDRGKFATPSLRNIALTAPYMHDGRFATLEEVVGHYRTGVKRSTTLDPNLAKHPEGGLPLTREDEAALVAFLRTLTDEKFQTPPVRNEHTALTTGAEM